MVDITDPQRYGDKLRTQLEKIASADIDERDRRAIQEYIRHCEAVRGLADSTLKSRANTLRTSSERATKSLMDFEGPGDIDAHSQRLKYEYDLAPGTIHNARTYLRDFFDHHDIEWADDVEVGSAPRSEVDETALLTEDEIDGILEAAPNARDKAIIALLLDTGLRIGALASLRVGDVAFEGEAGTISINTDAHVKGASGTIPLTWSRGYVANYLDVHPRSDDPEAALIHALQGYFDADDPDDTGAVSTNGLRRRLWRAAELADIPKERANPHRFRKTAISQWVRDRLPEQEIKHRATWSPDSSQMEVYAPIRDEEFNDQILDHYGLSSGDSPRPTLDTCPQCRTSLRDGTRFCPGCGTPLDARATTVNQEAQSAVADDLADTDLDGINEQRLARAMLDRIQNDPSFIENALDDAHDSPSS